MLYFCTQRHRMLKMADPKYANLPGIAYDQPDVYESSDLPEVDQLPFDIDDESESIERLSLNANEAHAKFRGKVLDASKTDFSDRITRSRRIGYDAASGEYEMVGDTGEKETAQQKYQRLQHELRELMEEVTQIKDSVKGSSGSPSPVVTSKQVEQLEHQLQDLRLEKVLGSEVLASLSDPQGTLQKQLLTQLEKLKTGSSATQKKGKSGTKDDQVVYELHYKPEQLKFTQTAKVADFEQRLEKLESVIGRDSDKLAVLSADTSQKSLMGCVSVLTAKTSLLDPEQLEQVEGRLQVVNQKLMQIAEKRAMVDDADKLSKVAEVYSMLKKVEALNSTLPEMVERMVALRDLHEQALQFSKALTQLDVTQQQMQPGLQDNQKLLHDVQSQFGKNMDSIKSNMASLDQRISALKK